MSQDSTSNSWARGGLLFAAITLMMAGVFQALQGIAAIARGAYFVVAPNYTYKINVTGWGWIHLIIGIVAAITGFFLLYSTSWMWRGLGIAFAAVSAILNFIWLPYQPIWAIIIIALDVFVIWSLSVVRP
ncbi:MAG: hypothetical protein HOV83_35030, partial [Catenulispora sp.]|nr:hypothetical protein [Catenulispora sp.]